MTDKRTAVKPPKWGYFPLIEKAKPTIEVGPRRPIYRDDEPLQPGQDARRDVFVDGECVGHVQQYTHESSVPMGRLRRVIGRPTHWIMNGRDFWNTFDQMNEAVYRLVEERLRATKGVKR